MTGNVPGSLPCSRCLAHTRFAVSHVKNIRHFKITVEVFLVKVVLEKLIATVRLKFQLKENFPFPVIVLIKVLFYPSGFYLATY